jgi:hypothetical protein
MCYYSPTDSTYYEIEMTKKDFELIAQALRQGRPIVNDSYSAVGVRNTIATANRAIDGVALNFADSLELHKDFDRAKFLNDCEYVKNR